MAERGRPRGFDRQRALRQAMEVFWEHGYEGTSIHDLTSAMGINAPSLYAAFSCKEALFREAVALYHEQEGAPLRRALAEAPSAREAIASMLRDGAIAYTEPGKPSGCMIVLAATTYTPKTEGIRDYLAEQRRAGTAELRERLERGRTDGAERPASPDASRSHPAIAASATASRPARPTPSRAWTDMPLSTVLR